MVVKWYCWHITKVLLIDNNCLEMMMDGGSWYTMSKMYSMGTYYNASVSLHIFVAASIMLYRYILHMHLCVYLLRIFHITRYRIILDMMDIGIWVIRQILICQCNSENFNRIVLQLLSCWFVQAKHDPSLNVCSFWYVFSLLHPVPHTLQWRFLSKSFDHPATPIFC